MKDRRHLLRAFGICCVMIAMGCAPTPTRHTAPAKADGPPVVILQVNTLTDNDLFIATGDLSQAIGEILDRRLRAERPTVMGLLRQEASAALRSKGFPVFPLNEVDNLVQAVPTGSAAAVASARTISSQGLVLYLELRRWDFDADLILASLQFDLLDIPSGRTLWEFEYRGKPIRTPTSSRTVQVVNFALKKIVSEAFADLTPAAAERR